MKKITILLIISMSILMLSYISFFHIKKAEAHGETYIFEGQRYIRVGGKYIKGKLIAKTQDGIKLYSVKKDKEYNYLVNSFGDLYVREDYWEDVTELTGIFSEGKYYDDKEILVFFEQLEQEVAGDDFGILETDNVYKSKVFDTSESRSIYLCYESVRASQTFEGIIVRRAEGYMFVDAELIRNIPYSGEECCYDGIKINDRYIALLEKYLY